MPLKISSELNINISDYFGYSNAQGDVYLDTTIPLEYSYDLLFIKLTCYLETRVKSILRIILGSNIEAKGKVLYSTFGRLFEDEKLNRLMEIAIFLHEKRNMLAHNFEYLPSKDKEFKKYINEIAKNIEQIETVNNKENNRLIRVVEEIIDYLKLVEIAIHNDEAILYSAPKKYWSECDMDDVEI